MGNIRNTCAKLIKYEYWPYWIFYLPVLPIGVVLGILTGSWSYFAAANPRMKYGGLLGSSKWDVLQLLPAVYIPKTVTVSSGTSFDQVMIEVSQSELSYPLIAKPDNGERGWRVEVIADSRMLRSYLDGFPEMVLLQEFVEWDWEFGILYHKMPKTGKVGITSITYKEFLTVTGDGASSLQDLLSKSVRHRLQISRLREAGSDLGAIIPMGKSIRLEPIGNHNRGTKFLDGWKYYDPRINEVMDRIASHLPDFWYGRFDLKVKDPQDLYTGEHIKVLEVNGVQSEPAHIYDPKHHIIRAYWDVAVHIWIVWKISVQNHQRGATYPPFIKFFREMRAYLGRKKKLVKGNIDPAF